MRRFPTIVVLALFALAPGVPSQAQSSDDDRYNIMRPEPTEPWLQPKYKSPRGTRQHVVIPRSAPAPQHPAQVPPPLLVPQTGTLLPNLPAVTGSGANGAETYQDRAVRCAHQAGVYGPAAGDRSSYINSCINQ